MYFLIAASGLVLSEMNPVHACTALHTNTSKLVQSGGSLHGWAKHYQGSQNGRIF